MAAKKPTIVLIPGGWFHPSTYDQFISVLQRLSFPTVYASNPSLNPSDPATADAAHDMEAVLRNFLLPLIENEGKDVVILMHSYGGMPGSSAARALAKDQRSKKAMKGGGVGLLYFSDPIIAEKNAPRMVIIIFTETQYDPQNSPYHFLAPFPLPLPPLSPPLSIPYTFVAINQVIGPGSLK